jgi:hypothetical protein
MSYMRMTRQGDEVSVQERSVGYRYYFSHSKWQAMAYVSNRMIIEVGAADWRSRFPAKAVSAMLYGEQHGLEVNAIEYALLGGISTERVSPGGGVKLGAIAAVYSGDKLIGFYAVKY